MKKYAIYALTAVLTLSLIGCGQTKKIETQKLQEIKEVKGSEITVGNEKINLNDTIVAVGSISDIKKGNKAYVISTSDKKYLVIYTGHKETKEKEGTEIIDIVKEAGNDGITLSNGKFYSATPNTTEQTIEGLENIKKYNPNDFKAGDIVRMLVKNNKIIAIVRY
jgi:outer membrane lipoprotein-sorting protein